MLRSLLWIFIYAIVLILFVNFCVLIFHYLLRALRYRIFFILCILSIGFILLFFTPEPYKTLLFWFFIIVMAAVLLSHVVYLYMNHYVHPLDEKSRLYKGKSGQKKYN